jgi:osmotically inducible lipoprotein OsmB
LTATYGITYIYGYPSPPRQIPVARIKGNTVNKIGKFFLGATTVLIIMSTAGCGTMTQRGTDTAIGAGVGGVAGAVLTGGSTWGTLGGAAIGGVIGNQIGK